MDVTCKAIKELYYSEDKHYRVVSCKPTRASYPDLQVNKWRNFTLSGDNLDFIELGKEYSLRIDILPSQKYEASYQMIGYQGVSLTDVGIEIDSKYQQEILSNITSKNLAKSITIAYPDFLKMVLLNQIDNIDCQKIPGVGPKKLRQIIDKVHENLKDIWFSTALIDYGITKRKDKNAICVKFDTPQQFVKSINESPYEIYIDELGWSFPRADKHVVAKLPGFIDSKIRCHRACIHILKQNEQNGSTRLNASQLAYEVNKVAPECLHHIVDCVTSNLYIHYDDVDKFVAREATYHMEQSIVKYLQTAKSIKSNLFNGVNWTEYRKFDGLELTDEQMKLLELVVHNPVTILTGPPGTGKTASLKALIKMFNDNLITYRLLAPTGIAAKRVSEATGRYASTIHMAIATKQTSGDYIIIDETSMAGIDVLSTLFSVCEPGTRFVFIGDVDQLPSVSYGNFFQDIIQSDLFPVASLTKVFRYNTSGIATMVTDVRLGSCEHIKQVYPDYEFIDNTTMDCSQSDMVVKLYQKYLDMGYTPYDIMVLAPYNIGTCGTIELNSRIQAICNPDGEPYRMFKYRGHEMELRKGDKVINTHNEYNMPLTFSSDSTSIMNGDIGTMEDRIGDETSRRFEYHIAFDGKLVEFNQDKIENILLAYAMSIHKSQGSQAKVVIVSLDDSQAGLMTRNLLYTALSRAQDHLALIGNVNTIKSAIKIQENIVRDTYMLDLFNEEIQQENNIN